MKQIRYRSSTKVLCITQCVMLSGNICREFQSRSQQLTDKAVALIVCWRLSSGEGERMETTNVLLSLFLIFISQANQDCKGNNIGHGDRDVKVIFECHLLKVNLSVEVSRLVNKNTCINQLFVKIHGETQGPLPVGTEDTIIVPNILDHPNHKQTGNMCRPTEVQVSATGWDVKKIYNTTFTLDPTLCKDFKKICCKYIDYNSNILNVKVMEEKNILDDKLIILNLECYTRSNLSIQFENYPEDFHIVKSMLQIPNPLKGHERCKHQEVKVWMQVQGTDSYKTTKFSIDPNSFVKYDTNLDIEQDYGNEIVIDLTKDVAVSERFWEQCFNRVSILRPGRGKVVFSGPINQTVIQEDPCNSEHLFVDYCFHGTISPRRKIITMGQKSQNNCSTSRSYQEVITQTRAKGKKEEEGKLF